MKINSSIKHVKRIFNIADIHIRLFKRAEEYSEVFDNLYHLLVNEDAEDGESVIVITGDIVHTKTEMSPEMVRNASKFLKVLADKCPVIIVPGNHDANLNNLQRLDAITPLVEILNHPNLFYLKETGLYEIGDNIIFSNMSIFDEVKRYIKAEDIHSDRTKIAIFHGTIDAAATDSGFRLRNKRVTLDLFDGYDIALIGDIHRHQVMQLKNEKEKKPYVIYPSSLIQQNYGELLDKHGILIWDVDAKEYQFKQIKNRYGYFTVNVEDGKIVSDLIDMPQMPRIRVMLQNTTAVQFKQCLIDLRAKYNPIEVTHNRIGGFKTANDDIVKVDFSKIRDVNFQNELISDYLLRNFPVGQTTLDAIFDINRHLNQLLPAQDIVRNIIWKPKVFTFSNMFSYGEDNIIDFAKMNGIVGLFAANASGKSSILDALTFCLFDKCSRAFKATHILNNRKDDFVCELNFEIGNVNYFIKKVAKRKNDKVSVKIDFWRVSADGEREDLNGDERKDTSSIIRSYIGTYDDFILTTLSSQLKNTNFIDLGQTDRKDLFAQFMDINIFDTLFDLGSEEIKEYVIALKEFQKRDFDKELNEIEIQLKTALNQNFTCTAIRNSLQNDVKAHNDSILELTRQLVKVDESIADIATSTAQKKDCEQLLEKLKKELEDVTQKLSDKMVEYNVIKSEIDSIDAKELETKYEQLRTMETSVAQLEANKEQMKIHVQHKLDKINKLGKLEYDPNCKYCMNNIFVKDAIDTRKSIEDDANYLEKLNTGISNGNYRVTELLPAREHWQNYQDKIQQLQQLKMEALQVNNKKSSYDSKMTYIQSTLDKAKENIELYYHSKDVIESNKKIQSEIDGFEIKLEKATQSLDTVQKELIKISSNILYLNNQKESINKDIQKFKEMEEKHECYQYYLEAIKRDGIPYELIAKTIPVVESEINNILNQIVDFSIMLEPDEKNINARVVYDESRFWPIEMVCGMEKFISGLAIRIALLNISNLPRSTFIAIDEGFSALDADNSSNLPVLLDYLRTQFEFSLIISHMDYMRDFVDISLDLQKVNDFTKIVYN